MDSDRIRGHLSMLLLSVLASGPAHGYALSAELRRRSNGLLTVVEGSLYPALHRLERSGLVASSWEVSDGRRRRSYALTVDGKDMLKDEVEMWRQFQRAVDAVVGQIP
jgi:transcriptional regulator